MEEFKPQEFRDWISCQRQQSFFGCCCCYLMSHHMDNLYIFWWLLMMMYMCSRGAGRDEWIHGWHSKNANNKKNSRGKRVKSQIVFCVSRDIVSNLYLSGSGLEINFTFITFSLLSFSTLKPLSRARVDVVHVWERFFTSPAQSLALVDIELVIRCGYNH